MDEIDQVVDNLFSQYIKPGSAVAPGSPKTPAPEAEQPPPPPVDQSSEELVMEVTPSSAPEIEETPAAQPDSPLTDVPEPALDLHTQQDSPKIDVPKKKRVKGDIDINEIKMQTAKMLRHLSMAVNSENWWHKLYYSHKFVRKSMYIAQIITKKKKD